MPPKEQKDEVPPTSPPASALKRPLAPKAAASPAKKQTKWTPEEDALIIELRGRGEKWDDISKRLPGRSAISCRLHYQNYLERRSEWDEERKNRLALLYERFKADMWQMIAKEMGIPWRAAEAMHWQLGEQDMAHRAGVVPFSLSSVAIDAPRRRAPATAAGPSSSSSAQGQKTSPTSPHDDRTPRYPGPYELPGPEHTRRYD
ncbi:hypothetical protein FN846DRAFT_270929 [Sphaerosporella brunnea]|uniref:Homeodomain-like protein n=1 Tax=Sphaerosporella brunnea TaxID=1250544 RepID=A0A5J5EMV3_9PEZI|nr:hypothetical protein FN846DRAFT_270929 [Sphaerosporella brunnea]